MRALLIKTFILGSAQCWAGSFDGDWRGTLRPSEESGMSPSELRLLIRSEKAAIYSRSGTYWDETWRDKATVSSAGNTCMIEHRVRQGGMKKDQMFRLEREGNSKIKASLKIIRYDIADGVVTGEATVEEVSATGELTLSDPESLIEAVQQGNTSAANRFLANGADVDAVDVQGKTALVYCAIDGYAEIAGILIRNGARANVRRSPPILWASASDQAGVVRLLLDHGSDVNATMPNGESALIASVRAGAGTDVVKLLIQNGADVNAKDHEGATALMCTVPGENYELARILLANKAKVDASDDNGQTPLMAASMLPQPRLVRLLLEKGADVNLRDKEGKTALGYVPDTVLRDLRGVNSSDFGKRAEAVERLLKQAGAKD